MRKYEVYKDNAGGITMFVWNESEEKIIYAHSGYEFFDGQLQEDIEALENGENPENWGGNGCYYGNANFDTWEEIGTTAEKVYEEVQDGDFELIESNC